MGRIAHIAVPLFVALIIIVFFREPARVFAYQVMGRIAPCTLAIPYRISTIDPRFGIAEEKIRSMLADAEKVWEDALPGVDLFVYSEKPVLEISFVYDDRQATTEKLNELGLTINSSLESYNDLKDAYEAERSKYAALKIAFERQKAAYDAAADTYESEVKKWNAQGGAPRSVHATLETERRRLESAQAELERARNALNASAGDVNTLASRLNKLARELNIDAVTFNSEVSTQDEFEEAVYESTPGKLTITVYEYDDLTRLQRVLTHEFGHALGIGHVPDEEAIMFSLNQGRSLKLAAQDIAALRAVCGAEAS